MEEAMNPVDAHVSEQQEGDHTEDESGPTWKHTDQLSTKTLEPEDKLETAGGSWNVPSGDSSTLSYSLLYPRTSAKNKATVGRLITGREDIAYLISLRTWFCERKHFKYMFEINNHVAHTIKCHVLIRAVSWF